MQEPHAHLHVIGEGPLRRDLESRVKRLGIRGHVTFHGAISHERLPAYYRSADLCVLSSRYESQGMVTLEAAACARATVGTAVGVLPDLTPTTRAVPVEDAGALAEALLMTLQDPLTVAVLGQASLATVAAHYSLERMLEKLCGVYAELSATRRP
jgi:glycosyltransferase involved in cell wall biosynthesis